METIGENEKLLEILSFDNTLLSGTILRFAISYDYYERTIGEIDIELIYSNTYKKVRLVFKNVIDFSFFDDDGAQIKYIVNLKFFKAENNFYISMDPYEEVQYRQEEDNFYMLSEEVVGFKIE